MMKHIPFLLFSNVPDRYKSFIYGLFLDFCTEKENKDILFAETILGLRVFKNKEYFSEEKEYYGLIRYLLHFSLISNRDYFSEAKKNFSSLNKREANKAYKKFFKNYSPVLLLFLPEWENSGFNNSYAEIYYTFSFLSFLSREYYLDKDDLEQIFECYKEFMIKINYPLNMTTLNMGLVKLVTDITVRMFGFLVFSYIFTDIEDDFYYQKLSELITIDKVYGTNFLYHFLKNQYRLNFFFKTKFLLNNVVKKTKDFAYPKIFRKYYLTKEIPILKNDSFNVVEIKKEINSLIKESIAYLEKKEDYSVEDLIKLYFFNEDRRYSSIKNNLVKNIIENFDKELNQEEVSFNFDEKNILGIIESIEESNKKERKFLLKLKENSNYILSNLNLVSVVFDITGFSVDKYKNLVSFIKAHKKIKNKELLIYLLSFVFLIRKVYIETLNEELDLVIETIEKLDIELIVKDMDLNKAKLIYLLLNFVFQKINIMFKPVYNKNFEEVIDIKYVQDNLKKIRKRLTKTDSKELLYFMFFCIASNPTRMTEGNFLLKNRIFFRTILNDYNNILSDYINFLEKDKFSLRGYQFGYFISFMKEMFKNKFSSTRKDEYIGKFSEVITLGELKAIILLMRTVLNLIFYRNLKLSLGEFYDYLGFMENIFYKVRNINFHLIKKGEKTINQLIEDFVKKGYVGYFCYLMSGIATKKEILDNFNKNSHNKNQMFYYLQNILEEIDDNEYILSINNPKQIFFNTSPFFTDSNYFLSLVLKDYLKEDYHFSPFRDENFFVNERIIKISVEKGRDWFNDSLIFVDTLKDLAPVKKVISSFPKAVLKTKINFRELAKYIVYKKEKQTKFSEFKKMIKEVVIDDDITYYMSASLTSDNLKNIMNMSINGVEEYPLIKNREDEIKFLKEVFLKKYLLYEEIIKKN